MQPPVEPCPCCGELRRFEDQRGNVSCAACGTEIEGPSLADVAVTFVQSGGRVSQGGVRVELASSCLIGAAAGTDAGVVAGYSDPARQAAEAVLVRIARTDRMQLGKAVEEEGARWLRLAMFSGLCARIANREVFSAACLYIACRRAKKQTLLIDFSDATGKPVKTICRAYMRLVWKFYSADRFFEVSIVDPSLYIERFANLLDLGENKRTVAGTACRVIQFMDRDWINVGRRPQGLCGAALRVACQFHGVECGLRQIADAVRMSEDTLRKRFRELRDSGDFARLEARNGALPRPDLAAGAREPPCRTRPAEGRAGKRRRAPSPPALPPPSSGPAPARDSDSETPPPPPPGPPPLQRSTSHFDPSVEGMEEQEREIRQKLSSCTVELALVGQGADAASPLSGQALPASAKENLESLGAGKPLFDEGAETDRVEEEGEDVENLSDLEPEALEAYLLDAEEVKAKKMIFEREQPSYDAEELERKKRRDRRKSASGESCRPRTTPEPAASAKQALQRRLPKAFQEAMGGASTKSAASSRGSFDPLADLFRHESPDLPALPAD